MRMRHPVVLSEQAVLACVMLAQLLFMTTSRIECRHALVRRVLRTYETLSRTAKLLYISSIFVLARARAIFQCAWSATAVVANRATFAALNVSQGWADRTSHAAGHTGTPQRQRRSGGPCRAYLNQLCSRLGRSLSWVLRNTTWSEDYNAIKANGGAEWRALLDAGRRATAAGHCPGPRTPEGL